MLFLISIDDLEDRIKNIVYKFADELKVWLEYKVKHSEKVCRSRKISINFLSGQKSGKCLSIQRSVVMYMGRTNQRFKTLRLKYTMEGQTLDSQQ